MKWTWRWLVGDYVPVESGLNTQERRRMLKPIFKQRIGNWLPAFYGGGMGLVFMALIFTGQVFTSLPIIVFFVILASMAMNLAGGFFIAHRTAPCIFDELRRRGIDLCSACNYNLRGLSAEIGACPECGAARRLMATKGVDPA
jgi:hypothetical protein